MPWEDFVRDHHHVVVERRVLAGVTLFTTLGLLLWIISVSTDYWIVVYSPNGSYLNKTDTYFSRSNSGLWKICRTEFSNRTSEHSQTPVFIRNCFYHQLFPTKEEIAQNPQIDLTIIHYSRTETAFSIISLILMIMGIGFSLYTFLEPRYMFKRLAAGVNFLTSATSLVVIEVLINSVHYEELYLPARHPRDALWNYGFSFFLAWISFVSYVTAGCAFLVTSRKHKSTKGASEIHALADEPHILGRV